MYAIRSYYEIAKRYLLPQEIKRHGLKTREIAISKTALAELINKYTREAGVRNLRRRIADIVRKSAKMILEDSSIDKVNISLKNLKNFVEKSVFEIDKTDHIARNNFV